MSKNNDKKSTLRLLRTQLKALKKAGETELAEKLNSRIETLKAQPSEVVMYFENGRVYFRTAYPGKTRQYPFSMKVKEAGKDVNGEHTHNYNPQTKEWSFKATESIVDNVRQAIGDFFSGAPVVNREGKPIGTLPASTYKG